MSEQKSLLTLTSEIAAIEQAILANDGELTPEIEKMLDLSTGDMKSKVDSYKHVMDAIDWRAAYFKSIKDQAAAAQKTFDGLKDRLKNNLKFCATKLKTDDLRGHDWRFKISTLKPKIVFDGTPVPPEFCKEVVTKTMAPDRDAIEKALLLGEAVPGAAFEEVQSLRSYVNNEPKQVKEAKGEQSRSKK